MSSTDGHAKTIHRVKELLTRRNLTDAADLLDRTPFNLYEARNHFNDEFGVLRFEVSLARYEELRLSRTDPYSRHLLGAIAEVFWELRIYIRIIVAEITEDSGLVAPPDPPITLEVVDRALRDAEILLAQAGPVSAVDRVHTALHGYLLDQCRRAGIANEVGDPNSSRLFGLIQRHPAFTQPQAGPWASQMTSLMRALGSIISVLEPLRNRGSVAHPNEELLSQAEAMLFINSARTVIHYLAAKLQG